MSDLIQFPRNFDSYVQQAFLAFEGADLTATIDYAEKALSIQMDNELFNFVISLLEEQTDYQKAIDLFKNYKAYLYDSHALAEEDMLFVSLFVKAGHFDQAKQQIKQRMIEGSRSSDHQHLFNILDYQLQVIEKKEEENKQREIAAIVAEFKSFEILPLYKQFSILRKLEKLPLLALIPIAEQLLLSEKVHPLFKTDICQLLIKQSFEGSLTIRKESFIETYPIEQLKPIEKTSFYQDCIELIQTDIDLESASFLEANLFLHLSYYYPFENQAFSSPNAWIESMLGYNTSERDAIQLAEEGLNQLGSV